MSRGTSGRGECPASGGLRRRLALHHLCVTDDERTRARLQQLNLTASLWVIFPSIRPRSTSVARITGTGVMRGDGDRVRVDKSGLHCGNRVAASSCRGHVDELATEPFLLLHREHGTGYRRSWNCCDWRTCFVVIWKQFCVYGHQDRDWLYDVPSVF